MKRQLSYEKVPDGTIPGKSKSFAELNEKVISRRKKIRNKEKSKEEQ